MNVVTNGKNIPHAVLLRAIAPVDGVACMLCRRNKHALNPKTLSKLISGPGTVTQPLGITLAHSGLSLHSQEIWIEDHGVKIPPPAYSPLHSVCIDYAGSDAFLPWCFCYKIS